MGSNVDTSFYTQSNPNALLGTAIQAGEARNLSQQNQLLTTENQQSQQNLGQQRLQYVAGQFSTLANKPDLSESDFANLGQSLVAEHGLDPVTYQTEMANVQAAGNDPMKLKALAQNFSMRALSGVPQLQSIYGSPVNINSGPAQIQGVQNPFTGGVTTSSSVQNALSPEAAATPTSVPTYGPDGQPTGGSTLTTIGKFSAAQNAQPSVANGQPTGMPAINPQQTTLNAASTAQFQQDRQLDANYTSDILPLQKVISLLPQTLTGPGAETVSNLAKVAQTFGINIPGSASQAEAYDEIKKYTTKLAANAGAAPNSDAQLAASFAGNPNVDMNNAAAQDVTKVALSLRRMQHAMITTAQQQGIPPQGYSSWLAQTAGNVDPRAYGVDLMTPAAKGALLKTIQSDQPAYQKETANGGQPKSAPAIEYAKFINGLRMADGAGVLGGVPSGQ